MMPASSSSPVPSRILIVDDEPLGREVLGGLLSTEPYDLGFAADGHEALASLERRRTDLMLLDVMMPGLDGFEVCRRVRRDPRLRELPIILVTALDDRESRLQGLEAGADDFLSKPFDRIELRARVRTVARLNRYGALLQERARVADSYEQALDGWMRALDLRDRETEGHTQRVTALTVALAREAGLSPDDCEVIRRGALLHDVGKIGVPDSILHKPGPLTADEREFMQRHVEFARDLLEPVKFLRSAVAIPYAHHERWDGSGYPEGLVGEAIPYAARLFAVVDAYDALVSERPYKAAWSRERALAEIERSAGSHFDPSVVALFLQLMAREEPAR
jgi:putative two-component system response regulator